MPKLQVIPVRPLIMARVHIDLMGEIKPKSDAGNRYIIVAVDSFTKYVEARGNNHTHTIFEFLNSRWIYALTNKIFSLF